MSVALSLYFEGIEQNHGLYVNFRSRQNSRFLQYKAMAARTSVGPISILFAFFLIFSEHIFIISNNFMSSKYITKSRCEILISIFLLVLLS